MFPDIGAYAMPSSLDIFWAAAITCDAGTSSVSLECKGFRQLINE